MLRALRAASKERTWSSRDSMRLEWLGGGIVIGVDGGEEGDGGRRGAREMS